MDEPEGEWKPIGSVVRLSEKYRLLPTYKRRGTMRIGEAFPSKYLKASDLNDKPWVLTMDRIEMEEVGRNKDERPILYFLKTEKGLVLNKTNSNIISKLYGDETDDWAGNQIELYPTMVDFQGDQVEAIRVRAPKKNAGTRTPQRQSEPPPQEPPPQDDLDRDEIPFDNAPSSARRMEQKGEGQQKMFQVRQDQAA